MARRADRIAAALLALLGLAHTAFGLKTLGTFEITRLWFLSGGLALALAAALNWAAADGGLTRGGRIAVALGNLALLLFTLAFAAVEGVRNPQGFVLLALAAWLTVRSVRAL